MFRIIFFLIVITLILLIFYSFILNVTDGIDHDMFPQYNITDGIDTNNHQAFDTIIIFPYRNREVHREKMIKYLSNYTKQRLPKKKFLFIIAEQSNDELFSRSWVFNAGFLWANQSGYTANCIIIHDIDRFPLKSALTVPYDKCNVPTHLAAENTQWGNGVPYYDFVGGVLSMRPEHWVKVNGMGNNFRGWGAEDDELFFRMKYNNFRIKRPQRGYGRFGSFKTDKFHVVEKNKAAYKKNVQMLDNIKRNKKSWKNDGLNTCQFSVKCVCQRYENEVSIITVSFI